MWNLFSSSGKHVKLHSLDPHVFWPEHITGKHILHKRSWEFYYHVLISSPGSWGWCPSSYIVAQYLLWNYELQPVNGLCILHNCVCRSRVVIEAKKEEKSGDIRWGHDHREEGTTGQLHIVSIPNSSQEEHLVFFSNVISWFSSKVHQQSVVMNFLWVLSFTIRNLALSFSLPTQHT